MYVSLNACSCFFVCNTNSSLWRLDQAEQGNINVFSIASSVGCLSMSIHVVVDLNLGQQVCICVSLENVSRRGGHKLTYTSVRKDQNTKARDNNEQNRGAGVFHGSVDSSLIL